MKFPRSKVFLGGRPYVLPNDVLIMAPRRYATV